MRTERVLSLLLVLAVAGLSVWAHFHLPDAPVTTHWGLNGQPDGSMPRDLALSLLPGMLLVFSLLLMWLLPAVMPKSASPARFLPVYGAVMLAVLTLIGGIHLMLVLSALGLPVDHTQVITWGLGALFVIIGNLLPKTRLNYLMGIRTPWTLSDERVWDRTHRFAGPLFVVAGVAAVAAGFLPQPAWRFGVMMVFILAPVAISVVYSWRVSKRLGLS